LFEIGIAIAAKIPALASAGMFAAESSHHFLLDV